MKNDAQYNYRAFICYHTFLRTIQLYVELSSNFLLVSNVAILLLLKGELDPEIAGLSLSVTTSIFGISSLFTKSAVETDNYMASPQRLMEYSNLTPEGTFVTENSFEVSKGKVEFRNVSMRYRPGFPLSLKDTNFVIPAGSKAGIIGRTGAGKSTIMQVLFRLVDPCQGTVFLDDQDYSLAGLHQLRKQMSVIPQTAFLFKASFRDNLDPFREYSDQKIKQVCQEVNLEFLVDKLNQGVEETNLNLSAGQKQLVCLARAILRENNIVMMDEATSNVDHETDKFIQKKIKEKFSGKTLLVIAHRLRTIVDSDLILVMDEGSCKEVGTPAELAQDPNKLFAKMISHTGPQESQVLLRKIFNS